MTRQYLFDFTFFFLLFAVIQVRGGWGRGLGRKRVKYQLVWILTQFCVGIWIHNVGVATATVCVTVPSTTQCFMCTVTVTLLFTSHDTGYIYCMSESFETYGNIVTLLQQHKVTICN